VAEGDHEVFWGSEEATEIALARGRSDSQKDKKASTSEERRERA